ncbi:lantibiotic dehydratase [Actinokineospora diospyrosa]|uniref:Lantibiotic dehydratase, C terminus n=1 Tax=Actinokineospora diospyrosa TaxID=103728 RepID=A0ABT1IFV1_9PSEU|nr:lantibiotic dehydratase [Actinokineospora diospyrosa]MCP2271156.1 Lantibiotic dehydratase, C terminus [Actinokineospora diospyrosa]
MSAWSMSSWAMLRRAGFPFDLLTPLRDDGFAERLRAAAAGGDWADAAARFDEVLSASVEHLVRAGRDERALEAIYLSSPEAYQRLRDWVHEDRGGPLNHRVKRRVQLLTMYLQRLCTKNETASFFGPLAWIRTGTADEPFRFADPGALRNRVFWSNWSVQQLARLVSADPAVWQALTPRATTQTFLTDGGARRIDFAEHPPLVEPVTELTDPALRELFALCDGRRTIAELAAGDPGELATRLAALVACGAVEVDITIPSGAPEPFTYLRDRVAELPQEPRGRWAAELDRLDELRQRVQDARGLTARIAAVEALNSGYADTGAGATARDGGKIASDRAIWYEDCRQDWGTAALAGPAAASLREEFPVLLELLFQLPLARLRARRAESHRWFVEVFGAGVEITVDEALAAAADTDLATRLQVLDDKQRAEYPAPLSAVLHANRHLPEVVLPMSWVREHLGDAPFDAWALCSADLHLSATGDDAVRAGEFTWVLGEVHALHEVLAGPFAMLHPDPGSLAEDCAAQREALSDTVICEPLKPHRGKMSVRVDTGGPQVEFSGRSAQPGRLRLTPGELRIRDEGDRLALRAERHGEVELVVPPQRWLADEGGSLFGCFTGVRAYQMVDFLGGPQVDHLPRLRIGRFVLARQTWWIDPEPAKRKIFHFDNQRLAWRIKHDNGLPDQVFVTFHEEPKPIFVDFRNPLLVEVFAKGAQSSEQPFRVTEMLPGPDAMWLDHGLGEHTNEFRIGFYRKADE